jgi:enoyl-CoA hydratase/carnithine racemase
MSSPPGDEGPVRVGVHGRVLVVAMQREDTRNAVDRAMADALDAAFNLLEDDDGLWAGVLTGTDRVFSAGSDLAAGGDYVTERGGEYGLVRRRRSKPLIAAVEGPALGGGLELALACDLVVAASSARFGLPEVAIGLVPTCGALFRAPRHFPLNVARQLVLTGEPLSAEDAFRLGFVTVLTDPGEALGEARTVADRICANGPVAVRAAMAALDAYVAADDDAGWAATATATERVRASADAHEGVQAFLEKRPPEWTGR